MAVNAETTWADRSAKAIVLIRVLVGWVLLSEGMLTIGLFVRLAAIPLLIDIGVAIFTTKLPMLSKAGFWATMHEARTDFCMLLGLLFLLTVGSGAFSLDKRRSLTRP